MKKKKKQYRRLPIINSNLLRNRKKFQLAGVRVFGSSDQTTGNTELDREWMKNA